MAQMLSMVCNERQDGWDTHVPHLEFAYNNSVSATTGLAPKKVHMNCLPRLPLAIFEIYYARGCQGLARDQLEYCDLAADRQRCVYALVREHAIPVSCVERRISALSDAFKQHPTYTIGDWVWYGFTTPLPPFKKMKIKEDHT